jgi:hypothetical protein
MDPDPDPGGPKTSGSGGSGIGSATLKETPRRKKNNSYVVFKLNTHGSQGNRVVVRRGEPLFRRPPPFLYSRLLVRFLKPT